MHHPPLHALTCPQALATLIVNKLRAGLKVAAVKAPGFGDNRKANLQDIAALTGGEVVSEELGYKMEKIEVSSLGSAKKVTLTKDDTIILHGAGVRDTIQVCVQTRCAGLERVGRGRGARGGCADQGVQGILHPAGARSFLCRSAC